MSSIILIICTWLHLIATVVWIGHIVNSVILFGPLSKKYISESVYGDFLADYRRRDQPIAISAIAVFFVTGLGLMLLNAQYQGFGNPFANSWSAVVFAKHIIVLIMVGLGVFMGTAIMPKLAESWSKLTAAASHPAAHSPIARLERLRSLVTFSLLLLGLAVLLLTALGENI